MRDYCSGVLTLIEAFVQSRLEHYQLVMVGDKPCETSEYEDVTFLGRVQDFELDELYKSASCFAYLSLYEGFGFPILEAQARGCPVITSNKGALAETAGDSALLVDPLSIESMANGFKQLTSDSNLRQELVNKGYENLARYSWEQTAIEYNELICRDKNEAAARFSSAS